MADLQETAREALKRKFPGLARDAAAGRPRPAVKLFCLECMGGDKSALRDAMTCPETTCPLWPLLRSRVVKVGGRRALEDLERAKAALPDAGRGKAR